MEYQVCLKLIHYGISLEMKRGKTEFKIDIVKGESDRILDIFIQVYQCLRDPQ